MTTPRFRFRDADTSRGTVSAGEAANEFFHPLLPVTVMPAAGFLLVLNGWNLNRIMADTEGHDNTASTALRMLQMRAPRQAILPLTSWPGTGRVFRPGAKYRYRWYDSRTGEHSGLSPIPDEETNLGIETPANSQTFLGQTSYFNIPTTDAPANADTCQLFANTTQQDDVWYLADELEIGSSSYIALKDDSTDDELFSQLAVVTGAPSAAPAGPTWQDNVMWPVVKAWQHPSGRVFYYGLRRFGQQATLIADANVTQGSDLVNITPSLDSQPGVIEPGRTGQRIRFGASASYTSEIDDPTVYRLVRAESASTFRVYPPLQVSSSLAEGATATWTFRIEDDRDARWTWMSEPRKPWLIDPLKTLAAGDDYDDGPMAWFSYGTKVYVQTKRRIYEAVGGFSDDPSRTTLFMPAAEEGTVGFWSGCETPFGWVYVHETQGVRVFNGAAATVPLGTANDPFSDFEPETQFGRFEPSMLESVRCAYDRENRAVIVSYVPTGQSALKETIVFDTTSRVWRGPYRERVTRTGKMRSTISSDLFVAGDDLGNLMVREAQSLDVTPAAYAGTNTITLWDGDRIFECTSGGFDTTEKMQVGGPVWFDDGTDLWYAHIADVNTTNQVELDAPPVKEDLSETGAVVGSPTYGIGSIRWTLTTAYVDPGGDPAKPIEFFRLNTLFKRGEASETFEVGAAENANGTYAGVGTTAATATAPTRDVNGQVHGELRLKRHGSTLQLRVRGLARNGEPQITRSILVSEMRDGATPT